MKPDKDKPQLPEDAKTLKPSVRAEDPKSPTSDFHPIRIKGEPLSATILRDRR